MRISGTAGIDYVGLAGNVHVDVPGRFIHVEGKRPTQIGTPVGRLTKGWVKTVMAILVQPELLVQPYRTLTLNADVATGTVIACLKHLRANRLLVVRGADRRLRAVPHLIAQCVATCADLLRPRLAERRFQVPAAAKADIAQPAVRGNLLVMETPGPLAVQTIGTPIPMAPLPLQYAELRFKGTEQAREAVDLLLPKLPELVLDEPPPQRTNDADAVVLVSTLAEFERVKAGLGLRRDAR